MSGIYNLTLSFHVANRFILSAALLIVFQCTVLAAPHEELQATPLQASAFAGDIPAMKALIGSGANVNEANALGNTPLHYALRRTSMERRQGRVAVVAFLVNHGANANCRTETGRTPLIDAADIGDTEALKYLIEHGAQADLSDQSGETAIGKAASQLYDDIVSYLVLHIKNIDPRDNQGRTPLMQAIAGGLISPSKADKDRIADETSKIAIVNTLLKYHADVNAVDLTGWTPLALATENNSIEIVKALISHGANQNIHVPSFGGETPLMTAIRKNNIQIFKVLVAAAPDLSLVNSQGRTALSYARGYRDEEMIEILRNAGAVH